ncbi:MAG: response regulator [Flavisolibacter sp.]
MATSQTQKLVVFYADDDPDDLDFVRESFLPYHNDIKLLTFPDAFALLDYIRPNHLNTPLPCLIILDINMPRLDGKETLKILRQWHDYDHVPIVLFSTSNAPHDANFGKQYNADFICKPLNSGQMKRIIEKLLKHCNDTIKSL